MPVCMAPAVGDKRHRASLELSGSAIIDHATGGIRNPECVRNIDKDGEGTENFAAALLEAGQQYGRTSRNDHYILAAESVHHKNFRNKQTIVLGQHVLAALPHEREAIKGQMWHRRSTANEAASPPWRWSSRVAAAECQLQRKSKKGRKGSDTSIQNERRRQAESGSCQGSDNMQAHGPHVWSYWPGNSGGLAIRS